MKNAMLFFVACLLLLGTKAPAQWQHVREFPNAGFSGGLGCHGLAVDPAGRIWIQLLDALPTETIIIPNYMTDVDTVNGVDSIEARVVPVRAIYVFNPDGSQAPFSPLKVISLPGGMFDTLGGRSVYVKGKLVWHPTLSPLSGRGLRKDQDGNILAVFTDKICRIDYQTGAGIVRLVVPGNAALAAPGVDGANNIYVNRVVANGGGLYVYDKDGLFLRNARDTLSSFSRTLEVSHDGNDIFFCGYTNHAVYQYHNSSGTGVLGPWDGVDTVLKGFDVESACWNPKTGMLWMSSGSHNDLPNRYPGVVTAYDVATWYSYNPVTKSLAGEKINWVFTNPGSPNERPRAIAFSPGGDTAYVGVFGDGAVPCVRMYVNTNIPFVTLKIPQGGETWKAGSVRDIMWNSGLIENIRIEYSTNNGSSWQDIVASTSAATGFYAWTIPGTVSTECRVRVSDAAHAAVFDVNDAPFTISLTGLGTEVEPNNAAGQANLMPYGDSLDAAISSAADVDYYMFSAVAGDTVEILGSTRNSSTLDAKILLYNSVGALLYQSDYGYTQRVVYRISTGGTYYIRYSYYANYTSFPNVGGGESGPEVVVPPWSALEKRSAEGSIAEATGTAGRMEEYRVHGREQAAQSAPRPEKPLSDNGEYRVILRRFAPGAPIARYAFSFNVFANSTQFGGYVDPNGLPTTVVFEYGTTMSFGSTVQAIENPLLGVGSDLYASTPDVTGLSANTTYYFRLVATNSAGMSYGPTGGFTTPPPAEGWTRQMSGTLNTLYDVDFSDANVGTAVGWEGTVLHTTDGGTTWVSQAVGTTARLNSVSVPDAATAMAVGEAGLFVKTTNGGTTWSSIYSGTSHWLFGIDFVNAQIGTTVGNGGTILRTTNGGASWTGQTSGTTLQLMGVDFTDASTGTVVGADGLILRTTNGGASWLAQTSGTNVSLLDVDFVDASNGTAVGDNGVILRTTNGGTNWVSQTSGSYGWIDAVSMANISRAYAVGSLGSLLRTMDGGATWSPQQAGTKNSLFGVLSKQDGKTVIVGSYGTILRSQSYVRLASPNGGEQWRVGQAKTIAWTSGDVSNVAIDYTTDNGSTWNPVTASTPAAPGSYAWTIPSTISAQCRVRITDVLDGSVSDQSDNVFSIVLTAPTTETEPNNTAAEANYMEYGDSLDATISTSADVDYYKFSAAAGDTVEINAGIRNTSALEGRIILYNSSGNYLSEYGWGTSQRVVYLVSSAGTYYIRYSYAGNYTSYPNVGGGGSGQEGGIPPWSALEKRPVNESIAEATGTAGRMEEFRVHGREVLQQSVPQPDKPLADNGEYRIRVKRFVPSSPVIQSGISISNTYWNSTQVYGYVDPNGLPTTVMFEYGTTTSYGNGAPATQNPIQGVGNSVYVSPLELTGLAANTMYYVRMVATNSAGTTYGSASSFTTPAAPEGWVRQTGGTTFSLLDVDFADANVGVCVGANGIILRSTDSGSGWVSQASGSGSYLYNTDFADVNVGIAVGTTGTILRTTNGGVSWTSQTSGISSILYGVDFADGNTGMAVGEMGAILKTTDGGANWVSQTSGTTAMLRAVHVVDANIATAIGLGGTILRTTNGGATWTGQASGTPTDLLGVSFINADTGCAIGSSGVILRTVNGGATWTLQQSGTSQSLYSIKLSALGEGTVVGVYGTILRTTDYGLHWSARNSGTFNSLRGLSVNGGGRTVIVGSYGTILRSQAYVRLASPNGGEQWRAGQAKTIVWTSGDVSNVALDYTTDNGSTWNPVIASTPAAPGSYAWTIPSTISAQCRVRITDVLDGSVSDQSDNVFSIVLTAPTTETEPNNTAAEANYMEYGDSLDAAISTSADVDYYKFIAAVGDTVEISGAVRNTSTLDGKIILYSSSGNSLLESNWGTTQRLVYMISSAGTYYIRYSHIYNYTSYPNVQPAELLDTEQTPAWSALEKLAGESAPVEATSAKERLEEYRSVRSLKSMQQNPRPDKALADNGEYRIRLRRFVPGAPTVQYSPYPTNLYSNSAQFECSASPNGIPTTVTFEYGLTTSYGNSVPALQNPITGISSSYVSSAEVTSLTPNSLYHVRLVATNSAGTAYSPDNVFNTPPSPDGWTRQPSGVTITLRGIGFCNADTGVAVSSAGVLLHTTDGGTTWMTLPSGTGSTLYDIQFKDQSVGVVVGSGGRILKSTDSGSNWSSRTSGTTSTLRSVDFGDGGTALAVGYNGTILKSVDGGESWTLLTSGSTSYLWDVAVVNGNVATVVGAGGLIHRTTDGGTNWVAQASGTSTDLMSVDFIDENAGWIAGGGGLVLRTTDGGANWTSQMVGSGYWLYGIHMTDASHGVAVGDFGTICQTLNGGVSWSSVESGTRNTLLAVASAGNQATTVVGSYGAILRSAPFVRVAAPNGGEQWRVGLVKNILWASQGVSDVAIDYTTDNGSSWNAVAASISAGAGSYAWTIPSTLSAQCRVRITNVTTPSLSDESDAVFSIAMTGPADEIEPNNTAAEANYIEYGDSLDASISTSADVDYYKFTAAAGDTVEILGSTRNSSTLEGSIRLYNNAGSLLYDAGWGYTQRVVYIVSSAGTYYIRYSYGGNYASYPNVGEEGSGPEGRVQTCSTLGKQAADESIAEATGTAGRMEQFRVHGREEIQQNAPQPQKPLADNGEYRIWLRRFVPGKPIARYVVYPRVSYSDAVQLYSYVDPNGLPTTVVFEYGTTTSYGSTAPATQNPIQGVAGDYYVTSDMITSLSPATAYHMRVAATNVAGTTYGPDRSITTPPASTSWTVHSINQDQQLWDVEFVNPMDGWVVGYGNTILRSSDGGITWTLQSSAVFGDWEDISFVDLSHGWVTGGNGVIARTTDGGSTWTAQTSGTSSFMEGIAFTDVSKGCAVGDFGTIIRTTNGGATWLPQSSGTSSYLSMIKFGDASNGWTVGRSGTILRTTDGGASWTPQVSGTTNNLYGLCAYDPTRCWVVGAYGTILNTTDGGASWVSQPSPTTVSLWAAAFVDSSRGWVVGTNGTILRTTDGGTTWLPDTSGTTNSLRGLAAAGEQTVVAIGYYGTILKRKAGVTACVEVSATAGWNLLSLPMSVQDSTLTSLFPSALSPAFAYEDGYVPVTSLRPGQGYWLKFPSPTSSHVCGTILPVRDVPVESGWNLIGPYDVGAQVSSVTTTPDGIITSAFFGYQSGYSDATLLAPGHGYWIKVGQDGVLHLHNGMGKKEEAVLADRATGWMRLDVREAQGSQMTLYVSPGGQPEPDWVLPPLPPSGIFDARFAGDQRVESASRRSIEILFAGAHPPVSITPRNLHGGLFRLFDSGTDKRQGILLKEGMPVVLSRERGSLVLSIEGEMPTQFELSQNFPNPFNPSTMVRFALPQAGTVRLVVYNVLGQQVAELVNGEYEAGYHEVTFEADRLASGVYVYRLEAGPFIGVKKMVVLK